METRDGCAAWTFCLVTAFVFHTHTHTHTHTHKKKSHKGLEWHEGKEPFTPRSLMITIFASTLKDIYCERAKVVDSDFRIIFFPANQTANQNPPNLKTQAFKAADGISAAHTYRTLSCTCVDGNIFIVIVIVLVANRPKI